MYLDSQDYISVFNLYVFLYSLLLYVPKPNT